MLSSSGESHVIEFGRHPGMPPVLFILALGEHPPYISLFRRCGKMWGIPHFCESWGIPHFPAQKLGIPHKCGEFSTNVGNSGLEISRIPQFSGKVGNSDVAFAGIPMSSAVVRRARGWCHNQKWSRTVILVMESSLTQRKAGE